MPQGYKYLYYIFSEKDTFCFNLKVLILFIFLNENIYCEYPLEAPPRGASNEYPQYMFSWKNKKTNYLDSPLLWSHAHIIVYIDNEPVSQHIFYAWSEVLWKPRCDNMTFCFHVQYFRLPTSHELRYYGSCD